MFEDDNDLPIVTVHETYCLRKLETSGSIRAGAREKHKSERRE